jgi:ribosomal protein L1
MKKFNFSNMFRFNGFQKKFFSPRAKTNIAKLPSIQKELVHIETKSNQSLLSETNKLDNLKNYNSYELDLDRSDLINEFYFINENKLITSKLYEGEDESEQQRDFNIHKEKTKYLRILHLFNKWKESKEKEGKSLDDLSAEEMPDELKLLLNQEEVELKNSGLVFDEGTDELAETTSSNIKDLIEDMKIPSEEFDYFEKYLDLKNRKVLITENKLREIENIRPKRLVKYNSNNGRVYIYDTPQEALEEIRIFADLKDLSKDEKLRLEVVMNLDIQKPDHNINGFIKMPGGLGETPKICVITTDDHKELCYNAGASVVMHSENLMNLSNLEDNHVGFNRIICTSGELETIIKLKEFLIKNNLQLPSVKNGTCVETTDELVNVINHLKSDTVLFETSLKLTQNQDNSTFNETVIDIELGNLSLNDASILRNIDSAMHTLLKHQPRSVMGRYLLSANLHINNKYFRVDIKSMNPSFRAYFGKNKTLKNILFK